MKSSTFRESALERLMRVTTPKGWLVLLGLFSLVASGVLWGVYGSIAVTLSGQGILLRAGGVHPVQPLADGVIERIYVAPGAQVSRGEVVARVSRTDLANQIKEIGIRLKDLEEKKAQSRQYRDRENELQRVYLEQEEANTTASIRRVTGNSLFSLKGKCKAWRGYSGPEELPGSS